MRNLLFCIDVHLTVLTIKLQTKLPPVGKHEMERLAPLWTLATTTHAIAQNVPQTMATLHDQVGRVLGKIFRPTLLISLGQTRKSAKDSSDCILEACNPADIEDVGAPL